jgi:hypothetical protein
MLKVELDAALLGRSADQLPQGGTRDPSSEE